MAKFDTVKDDRGLTRRERGARVKGYVAPSPELPDGFAYIIPWFYELRSFCDDRDKPVTPLALKAWEDCQGFLLSSWERAILFSMDRVYRHALAEEIAYNEDRRNAVNARKAKK